MQLFGMLDKFIKNENIELQGRTYAKVKNNGIIKFKLFISKKLIFFCYLNLFSTRDIERAFKKIKI